MPAARLSEPGGAFDVDIGVFEPCWRHQSVGWKTERENLDKRTAIAIAVTFVVLASLGLAASFAVGYWTMAIANGLIWSGAVLDCTVRRHRRKLTDELRHKAELAGQVEHEGPPALPPARVEGKRKS